MAPKESDIWGDTEVKEFKELVAQGVIKYPRIGMPTAEELVEKDREIISVKDFWTNIAKELATKMKVHDSNYEERSMWVIMNKAAKLKIPIPLLNQYRTGPAWD